MEALRQWALCLIAAAGAGAFACTVIPGGSMEKTVKAISGVFVVVAICAPLGEISLSEAFSELAFAADAEEYSAQTGALEESTLELCREAITEAISEAAIACGVKTEQIIAELEVSEDGIIIHGVTVVLDDSEDGKTEEFSFCAAERLGFPINTEER